MTVLPVIQRELLSQSRQPATYWLRVLASTTLAGAVWLSMTKWQGQTVPSGWFAQLPRPDVRVFGAALFGNLNLAMLLVLWFLVPLLAADAISRERREGTLGLLLLTPLRPGGVVMGKVAAHVFRAFSLFLAMLPWLMFPVLTGGVGWQDVAMATIINGSILFLALSAGLLASSCSDDWMKNSLLALLLTAVLGLNGLALHRGALEHARSRFAPANPAAQGWSVPIAAWGGADSVLAGQGFFSGVRRLLAFASNSEMEVGYGLAGRPASLISNWATVWIRSPSAMHKRWFAAAGSVLALSVGAFALAAWVAARRVAASWRDSPRRPDNHGFRRTFLAPRFAPLLFRSRMKRTLERNPIGWLQQRSPQARLVKWGWCLAMMGLVILLSVDVFDLPAGMAGLQLLLLLSLALSAAGSFRHERESGAFELLLITPLSVDQIILGRLRGLWMQFLPAAVILLCSIAYVGTFIGRAGDFRAPEVALQAARFGCAFLGVSVVGLWLSSRRLQYLTAWLLTCALVLVVPQVLAFGIAFMPATLAASVAASVLVGVGPLAIGALQLLLALVAWLSLRHHLVHRRFVLT